MRFTTTASAKSRPLLGSIIDGACRKPAGGDRRVGVRQRSVNIEHPDAQRNRRHISGSDSCGTDTLGYPVNKKPFYSQFNPQICELPRRSLQDRLAGSEANGRLD